MFDRRRHSHRIGVRGKIDLGAYAIWRFRCILFRKVISWLHLAARRSIRRCAPANGLADVKSPEEEIRELQRLVYGRRSAATPEQSARLRLLLESRAGDFTVVSGDLKEDAVDEPGTDEGAGVKILPSVRTRRHRSFVMGLGAALLSASGFCAGFGISWLTAPHALVNIIPPGIETLVPQSVVYFGVHQEVSVWAGMQVDGGARCVIVLTPLTNDHRSCAPDGEDVATIELPTRSPDLMQRFTATFPGHGEAPLLRTLTVPKSQ